MTREDMCLREPFRHYGPPGTPVSTNAPRYTLTCSNRWAVRVWMGAWDRREHAGEPVLEAEARPSSDMRPAPFSPRSVRPAET
jgi:hypothetical protein